MASGFERPVVVERIGRSSAARFGDRGNPFAFRRYRNKPTPANVVPYGASPTSGLSKPSERQIMPVVSETETSSPPLEPVDKPPVPHVKMVDLEVEENTALHHTDKFEITHRMVDDVPNNPQLVVRRGQPFDLSFTLDNPFNPKKDDFKLIFEMGEIPRESKKSRVRIIVSEVDVEGEWGAKVLKHKGNEVQMRIFTPPDCFVGKWRLAVETIHQEKDEEPVIYRFSREIYIYILFNPWCKDDSVYMSDETKRNEYVLNDTGKIYTGNYKKIGSRPWNFGQFESFILDCALYLLEASGLSYTARGNPIAVTRKISAIINSCDDDGVLTGNWSGNYEGGTSPTAWVGSVAILEQFWETRKPVQFGQCWVFSGVTTTVCRALGIPARSVTNFASAHDTDGSITIDIHFDVKGEPLEELNSDSVWNFHVWNDVWMARPDLPAGCGGWQAIDATPQETSDGVYCAGPASVAAIRNGLTTLPYDTGFLFGEVNADRVYWIVDQYGSYTKVKMDKLSIGKTIVAKTPTGKLAEGLSFYRRGHQDPDKDDVTKAYKFGEGSEEERVAVRKACEGACVQRDAYDEPGQDVTFELMEEDEINLGEGFDVVLKVKNKASEPRDVHATLTASVIYYTGVPVGQVGKNRSQVTLNAGQESTVVLHVSADEYVDQLKEHCCFKMSAMARVTQTKQYFCATDDFRLLRPDITLKPSSTQLKRGQNFQLTLSFTNPLNRVLTKCEFQVEGPGLARPMRIPVPFVLPRAKVERTVTLRPRPSGQVGPRQLMAGFDSMQLKDISGYCNVNVD